MSENNNRLKNFLVNGFQALDGREQEEPVEGEEVIEAYDASEDIAPAEPAEAPVQQTQPASEQPDNSALKGIESELIRIRYMLEDLSARPAPEARDMDQYLTTRELSKSINAKVAEIGAAAANKQMVKAMEQVSAMREDFFKLCKGMRERIADMDAETVLSSFEAYQVDMENILTDAGVYVGRFDYDRLNTLHQRIVGVVPTDEKEKDGTIAERQSDGYKLGDKVLLKERVTVYKYAGDPAPCDAQVETSSETPSETDSKPVQDQPGESADECADQAGTEEKE